MNIRACFLTFFIFQPPRRGPLLETPHKTGTGSKKIQQPVTNGKTAARALPATKSEESDMKNLTTDEHG